MRQEIERAVSGATWSEEDFWAIPKHRMGIRKGWDILYKDPYRKEIHASNMPALVGLSHGVSRCIAEGLAASDVVIITLGLTECWRNKTNGRYVCMGPRDERDPILGLVEFHATDFVDNYANIHAIIDCIWSAYPDKKIVLTVSPVTLGRTWTGEDVVTANLMSKATLRAVAGQTCRDRPAITYWPSFEYAMMENDIYAEDGMHVRPDAVEQIVTGFLTTHQA